jgi:hypothetical protein
MIRPSGQSLVLFTLTFLFLTLMVLLTLGLSQRIHEKQELQVAADAAAYSEAVSNARAFNAVAAENRVLVAELASVAAAQSLISWIGFYHGILNQARDVFFDMENQAACGGAAVWKNAHTMIQDEDRRLIEIFEPPGGGYGGVYGYDFNAGKYVKDDLYLTALDVAENQKQLYRDLTVDVEKIAQNVATRARLGDKFGSSAQEFFTPAQTITHQELNRTVVEKQRDGVDLNRATMGTRGIDPFISARTANPRTNAVSGAEFIRLRLVAILNAAGAPLVPTLTDFGTGYIGNRGPYRPSGIAEVDGHDNETLNGPDWVRWQEIVTDETLPLTGAWGQDNGLFSFTWPGAPAGCTLRTYTEDAFGYVLATSPNDGRDQHMWRRGDPLIGDYREWHDEANRVAAWAEPGPRHGFDVVPTDVAAGSLSIFPVFTDFDATNLDKGLASATDAYGQPKALVAMRRDYSARGTGNKEPWELKFDFHFSSTGSKIDMRNDRTGFDHAVAIGAGITYYHRDNVAGQVHSREPPNFLNPFWRGTLAASDFDESYAQRGTSVRQTLATDLSEPVLASTFDQLRGAGFEAIP